MWVLSEYGEDITPTETYLRNAISADPNLRDFWYLEVITSNNGTCKISYHAGNNDVQKDVPVSQGHFPSCPQSPVSTFFDLNACLEPNLLSKNPGIELDVNCNALGPSTILSIIFNKGSEYHIIEKAETSRQIFTIDNGCFGTTKKSSCNVDTSLFTNWLLSATGSDLATSLHLRNTYDKFKALDNALLALSRKDQLKQQFIKDLVSLQRNDGSFNKQVFETAMAVLALKGSSEGNALASATSWLQSKQASDGSWESNEVKTAATLYAAFSGAAINLPPPTLIGQPPEPIFECGDSICDPETENENTCPDDCGEPTTCEVNGICQTSFEDSSTCAQDCYCGDGVCDNAELARNSCSTDCEQAPQGPTCGNGIVEGAEECDIDPLTGFGDDTACPGQCQSTCSCEEEKGGFPWWISIIIAILLIGLLLFYMKFRGSKKGGKQPPRTYLTPFTPSTPPLMMPRMPPPQSTKKSKIEDELDKSIEEAKKLLKKI